MVDGLDFTPQRNQAVTLKRIEHRLYNGTAYALVSDTFSLHRDILAVIFIKIFGFGNFSSLIVSGDDALSFQIPQCPSLKVELVDKNKLKCSASASEVFGLIPDEIELRKQKYQWSVSG